MAISAWKEDIATWTSLCLLVFPFIHCSLLRGEIDANLEDAAAIMLERQRIVRGINLLKAFSAL
jgi:hypothetical protein